MLPFRPAAARGSTRGRIRHRMRVLCAELRRGLVRMLALALGTALLAGRHGRTAADRPSARGGHPGALRRPGPERALLAAGCAATYATCRRTSR